MNIEKIKEFLIKFNINKDIILKFLENKKIENKNNNIFLIENEFKTNQIYKEELIFIKLNLILPSKYLLKFISENTKNIIEAKSEKQAIEFTYGKSLSFQSIINKYQLKFKEEELYLITYQKSIIGYFKYDPKNKTHPIKNLMNIGEYLHEN